MTDTPETILAWSYTDHWGNELRWWEEGDMNDGVTPYTLTSTYNALEERYRIIAGDKVNLRDKLSSVEAERDRLRAALEKIEQCAKVNLGRQTEKLADIEPIARAALEGGE